MKTKILIQIDEVDNEFIGHTKWSENKFIQNITLENDNRDTLIHDLTKEINEIMSSTAVKYISFFSISENSIFCPDAKIVLPIDSICCKEDEEICSIGGGIDLRNKALFMDTCRINRKKEGIWEAITTGKYKGFHHVTGKYLCPNCERKKPSFNYHYPWELITLSDFVNFLDESVRTKMITKKINKAVSYSSYCIDCSIILIQQLELPLNLEIIHTEVFRES